MNINIINISTGSKTTAPQLSDDAAAKLLQNVFESCQKEPNTIPLPKLASYSEYRRERYGTQKLLLIAVLALFLLLPAFFVAPRFTVTRSETSPAYEIRVENRLPVSQVAASVDGEGLVVSEVSDHVYSVTPDTNGTMKVIVRLFNRQYCVQELTISGVDSKPPVLIEDRMTDEGKLQFRVEDTGSGIDYASVYAIAPDGSELRPESAADGVLTFDLPDGSTNIYIPDNNGNTLQLVVSIHSSEDEEADTAAGEASASADEE